MMGSEMMEGMGIMPGCGMYLGMLFWILLLAGVVALVVWAIQKSGKTVVEPAQETALEVLKKRYALGEIDTEEFEEKKKRLQ
jgi:putative membrane protein